MTNPKKILFVPLDWGLGHASRCIPLIAQCISCGHEVLIAGNENTNALLRIEFPQLHYLELRGYDIRYSSKKWWLPFSIIAQFPGIISTMKHENKWLSRVIDDYKIDLVFSDNRYGLYTSKIPCFFITHQLHIQVPQSKWIEKVVNKLNHFYTKKFTICLVPDYEGENMSGLLSQKGSLKHVEYIGNLSRFFLPEKTDYEYDLLLLLSGPEPQRSLLEDMLLSELKDSEYKTLLVRGKPVCDEICTPTSFLKVINHLPAKALQQAILNSKVIISRSGYSTIMDLIKLKKHALLIPTPGQTEQEYLGNYLMEKKWFVSCKQKDISFSELMEMYNSFSFKKFPEWDLEMYKKKMNELIY